MGKFLEDTKHTSRAKNVVSNYIDSYMEGTKDYARNIDSAPNFVTYYSNDPTESTEDHGLGGVIENIGHESPLRFNKISNFPLYNVEEMAPGIEYDEEVGINGEMSGQAVILPGTIEPQIGDYVIFSYHEHNQEFLRTYRVTDVNMSSINSNAFFQISYSLDSGVDLTILDDKQVSDSFLTLYENIGTEKRAVIHESEYLFLSSLKDTFNEVTKYYVEAFWNRQKNSFICEDIDGTLIYDKHLHRFVSDSNLFIDTGTYLKNMYIKSTGNQIKRDYNRSIYFTIKNYKNSSVNGVFMRMPSAKEGIFKLFPEKYNDLQYFNGSTIPDTNNFSHKGEDGSGFRNLFPLEINDVLSSYENVLSLTGISLYTKLITLYLKEDIDSIDLGMLRELNDLVKSEDLAIEDYILLPVILYIVKEVIAYITKK